LNPHAGEPTKRSRLGNHASEAERGDSFA